MYAEALNGQKTFAVREGNEELAKRIWCLEQALFAQRFYIKAFEELKEGEFYKAWCTLERVENSLAFLGRHQDVQSSAYHLYFIKESVSRWQKLFPYKIFLSPEFIEKKVICSICGAQVMPRHPCGHTVGEIYGGNQCCRVVKDAEFVGVGMVENPVQKYSVAFVTGNDGERKDQFDYKAVRFAINNIDDPKDVWSFRTTTRLEPHSSFGHIGRNELCPCGSKKKYKKCCLNRPGVIMPHLEFDFGQRERKRRLTSVEVLPRALATNNLDDMPVTTNEVLL